MERRRHERVPCLIPCDVQGSGKSVAGIARDVSVGGLCVQVEMEVEQGDVLQVVLHPERRDAVEIEAIVWHARRARQRKSGKTANRLGLVLSEAPEGFQELLRRPGQGPESQPSAEESPPGTKPAAAPEQPTPGSAEAAGLPKPKRYRVRVKLDGTNRTRSILVFARNEDEARTSALAETGGGWLILELERT